MNENKIPTNLEKDELFFKKRLFTYLKGFEEQEKYEVYKTISQLGDPLVDTFTITVDLYGTRYKRILEIKVGKIEEIEHPCSNKVTLKE